MSENVVQSDFSFHLMSLKFRLRDWRKPPVEILQEAGVKSGMTVLDFGCGPGGFSIAAAQLVGSNGQIYAVDINPLAFSSVRKAAGKLGLNNIQTIFLSDLVNVRHNSVDFALLYDVLHYLLPEPGSVLTALHQVLKPKGVLSVSDHHMEDASIISAISNDEHYCLAARTQWTFQFDKTQAKGASK